MILEFKVVNTGDVDAGMTPYTEIITVEVDSGDPGGESGEFELFMSQSLGEWFDGAKVTCKSHAVTEVEVITTEDLQKVIHDLEHAAFNLCESSDDDICQGVFESTCSEVTMYLAIRNLKSIKERLVNADTKAN